MTHSWEVPDPKKQPFGTVPNRCEPLNLHKNGYQLFTSCVVDIF